MRYYFCVIFYLMNCYCSVGQIPKPFDGGHRLVYKKLPVDAMLDSRFVVQDGIFINTEERKINWTDMKNIKRISDPDVLKRIGVLDTTNSYSFVNTNVTEFHEFIYKKTKTHLDWGMNIPLIIDQKLVNFEDYATLKNSDTTRVRRTQFVPKSNILLKYNSKIAFGAILVDME